MTRTLLALCGLLALGAAQAQPAGTWLVQAGLTRIAPDVSSGNLSAPSPVGTQVDAGADTQPTAQITYVHDGHWALALPVGAGFTHKIYGAGAIAGTGQIGSIKVLPVSVFGQYRFNEPEAQLRPYAMLGLSYAYFRGAQGSAALNGMNPINPPGGSTTMKSDSGWAWNAGLGVAVRLDAQWFVDVSWSKSWLKTTTTLSTGQTLSARLDPGITMVGLGRRF